MASNWEEVAYRDLQAECKARGLPAKGSKAELIGRLLLAEGGVAPQSPVSPVSSPRAGRTPRSAAAKSARGARSAAKAAWSEDEPVSPPATTPSRVAAAAALRQAAKTPLPSTPPTNGAATPAATPARRPQQGSRGPSIGRLLVLAALAAAVAAIAAPAWQKHDCTARLRQQFPGPAQHVERLAGSAQAVLAQAAKRMGAALPPTLLADTQKHYLRSRAALEQQWQAAADRGTQLWGASQQHVLELWGAARQRGAQAWAAVQQRAAKLQSPATPAPEPAPSAGEAHAEAEQEPPAPAPAEVPAEPEQAVPAEPPAEPEPQVVAEPPAEPEPEQQAVPATPELRVASPPPAEPEAAAPPPVQQHPVCTGALHIAALDNIVPAGPQWEHVKATVAAVWQGQRPEPNRPATMLFACVAANCQNMNDWLAWAVPEECRLKLEASELGEDRAALQGRLSAFLDHNPRGTVLITNVHKLSPALIPALNVALSENAAHASANFLLSAEMPRSIFDAESEAQFKVNAKGQLVVQLAAGSADPEAAADAAKALRRRIELVVPAVY